MVARSDNLPWRASVWKGLWEYVCLWDDDTQAKSEPGEDDGDEGFNEDEDGGEEIGTEDEDETEPKPRYGIVEPEPSPPAIPGFSTTKNSDGSVDYLREFDSWWSFAQSASDEAQAKWREANRKSHYGMPTNWSGTKSFDEAVEMALRRGWPEGRELLNEGLVAVRPRPKFYESLEFEVAGAFPCVPLYCAGDPQWMVSDPGANFRTAKPIVRIDYNHYITGNVDIKSMMLRGAAIVSLADSLECQGFSTELRIIGNSAAPFSEKVFRYSIVYKRAGEPLDLDRAAFAIAHPSSMRRLAFAILEQHKDLEPDFKSTYGGPLYERNPAGARSEQAMTTLFVPGSRGRETPESANAAVAKAAEALLNQLNQKDLAA